MYVGHDLSLIGETLISLKWNFKALMIKNDSRNRSENGGLRLKNSLKRFMKVIFFS